LENVIRKVTTIFGQTSIVGPDKAFGFCKVDQNFIDSVNKQTKKAMDLIISSNRCSNIVKERHVKIFATRPIKGESIVDYYIRFLSNIIDIFCLSNVTLSKMTSLEKENKLLYKKFQSDSSFREVYQSALELDGVKNQKDTPFYLINKINGDRMLDVASNFLEDETLFLSPKVLMLNNLKNLVLPYEANDKRNVHARETIYKSGFVNCNQVFLDDNWLNYLERFDIKIDDKAAEFFDKDFYKQLAVSEESLAVLTASEKDNLRDWFIESTKSSISHFKYPILFLVIFGDDIFCKNLESLDFYELS
jgi:hypothetical protein